MTINGVAGVDLILPHGMFTSVVEQARNAILFAVIPPAAPFLPRIVYANAAFHAMTGYTPAEVIGDTLACVCGSDTDQTVLEQIAYAAENRQSFFGDMRQYRKDGTPVWVELHMFPVSDADGMQEYVTFVQHEITAQRALLEAHEAATAELTRSNRALQEFASVASHDLQEPLRKIMTFGAYLGEATENTLDAEARDYLDRMLHAAGRMRILINDLLAFSRVTARVQPFVPVDLAQTVHDVVTDLEAQLIETHGRVIVGELVTLDADPRQMGMVFQNLISNALKFARPGIPPEVTISGQIVAPPHRAATRGEGRRWYAVQVTDNGIGFDPKYAEKIFAVFHRLHRRSEYEGTGIGLAICREIAANHGGMVTAMAVPGAGASFTLTLPMHAHKGGPP